MKNVLILHGYTTEYRVPFFKELERILKENNISIKIVIGQPSKFEKYGEIEKLSTFQNVKNRYFYLGESYLIWEPIFNFLSGQDLIIIRQANKHLINPLVYGYCRLNGIKIGMWGNMKNYFNSGTKVRNPLISMVDHWFAYNNLTKELVKSTGYPKNKITSINNSIDSKTERAYYQSLTRDEICLLEEQYKIDSTDIVGVFCSRLYKDKRIDFLLDTLIKVKCRIPNFKFFVIGEGTEYLKIKDFAEKHGDWFFWVGSQYGPEKVKYFKMSSFQLIPGLVGLHIVDSFALETPIITTANKLHSVEIDYLINFENGLMCNDNIDDYANSIINVCQNKELRKKLQVGCSIAAEKYTIENMAQNFAEGILTCLNEKGK